MAEKTTMIGPSTLKVICRDRAVVSCARALEDRKLRRLREPKNCSVDIMDLELGRFLSLNCFLLVPLLSLFPFSFLLTVLSLFSNSLPLPALQRNH